MSEYQWFVEPKNSLTNEAIAAELAASGRASDTEIRSRAGERMYRVEWSFIRSLYELRNGSMSFSVYNRIGRDGTPRNVTGIADRMCGKKPSSSVKKAKSGLATLRRNTKTV